MESRKIYISGGSTYVISLPKKWVEKERLKAGDSVTVTTREGSVVIEPGMKQQAPLSVELLVSKLVSPVALQHLLISYYLVGYDTIRVRLDADGDRYREALRETLDYLIGAEILEDTGDAVTVEVLLDQSKMQTVQILQRIHVICKSMLADVIQGFEKGDASHVKDVPTREKEVDRLYFLVVRQLKSAVRYQQMSERLGISNQRDALGYRIAVKSFERIADHLDNIAQNFATGYGGSWEGYWEFSELVGRIYELAAKSFFARNKETAEGVFTDVQRLENQRTALLNRLFQKKANVQDALTKKAVLDSLSRIANYSSDIAEITINMSIEVP